MTWVSKAENNDAAGSCASTYPTQIQRKREGLASKHLNSNVVA